MSMLRKAMENMQAENTAGPKVDETRVGSEDQPFVKMTGPLAEAYTKALNIAYAKTDPETGKAVLESQAIDATIMEKLARSLQTEGDPAPTDSFQTVYGVSKNNATDADIVAVTNDLATSNSGGGGNLPDDYILIVDGTQPGEASVERAIQLSSALECMVIAHGGKVYHSLAEYVNTRK